MALENEDILEVYGVELDEIQELSSVDEYHILNRLRFRPYWEKREYKTELEKLCCIVLKNNLLYGKRIKLNKIRIINTVKKCIEELTEILQDKEMSPDFIQNILATLNDESERRIWCLQVARFIVKY